MRRLCAAACLGFTLAHAAGPMPPAVTALLRNSGLPIASYGIDIRSVESGDPEPLVALNAERPFLLASTTKLVTSLAALDLLGADHRWKTDAYATGPLSDGRLSGDLVIVGGDVGLTATELRRWFAQMRAEGVEEIAGNIVLEGVALLHERDPAQASTTTEERLSDAPVDARTYNLGKLLVSVRPAAGERAAVTLRPLPANVVIVNEVFMGGGCSAWARWRSADETRGGPPLQLWVRGRWDTSCGSEDIAYVRPPPEVRLVPERGAAAAAPIAAPRMVANLWAEAGGRLRGQVVEADAPNTTRSVSALRHVGQAAGRWSGAVATPLAEVMREMNKTSNNAAARSMLLSLAVDTASRRKAAPARAGALRSAQARVQEWLRAQGLANDDIHIDEGSGQSRAERGKPRALVQLLCNAWRGPSSQAFIDSLPIAGVDGTLVHRMRNGSVSGQAYLKTGTLSDTRALAGYVRGKSGKVYAVTAIVTHPDAARGTPALDALIEWVAREG